MEINNTCLNLQEVTEDMVKVLGNEVEGYQLGSAEICNVYCRPILNNAPTVVIPAHKGKKVKYLIYSPLDAQMMVTDEPPASVSMLGECSVNGCLSATVVEEKGKKTLFLKVREDDGFCNTEKKAVNRITALLAVTHERTLRIAYYLSEPDVRIPTPRIVIGFLCWGISLSQKGNWKTSILVNVGSSHVYSFGSDKMYYNDIAAAGSYGTIEKGIPIRQFIWNGKFFVPDVEKGSRIACCNAAV